MRFSHNIKQEDYIEWKFKLNFCKKTQGLYNEIRKRPRGVYTSSVFYTERRPEFKGIYDKWYIPTTCTSGGTVKTSFVKTIPSDLDKILTDPLALAVWDLDDGTKRGDTQSCRIATQSPSKEGNKIIQACLLQNFGIRLSIESWG